MSFYFMLVSTTITTITTRTTAAAPPPSAAPNTCLCIYSNNKNNGICFFKRRTIHVLNWRLIILCYIRNATKFRSCNFIFVINLLFSFMLMVKIMQIFIDWNECPNLYICDGIGAKFSIQKTISIEHNWTKPTQVILLLHPVNYFIVNAKGVCAKKRWIVCDIEIIAILWRQIMVAQSIFTF